LSWTILPPGHASPVPKYLGVFRDLRAVPGSVKDVHFGFRGCSRLGWIKVN
jgi:hypothetical protein